MVLSLRFSSWDSSKGELSFPWNLLLYGYKTIIPSPAGDSVLLLGPVTRLVSKLSREDRTIGLPDNAVRFNVMPRRIPDFPDSFHSWNFLSSIGSGITFLSFAIF
jgi:hypothetical protein